MHDGCDKVVSPQLDERQQKALDLLMSGCTKAEIARQVGISRQTLYTWIHEDRAFRTTLQTHPQTALHMALAPRAVHVLEKLLNSKNEGIRLKASAAILKFVGLAMDEDNEYKRSPLERLELYRRAHGHEYGAPGTQTR